jgi:F-type H+-transporting ATPase subunit delta
MSLRTSATRYARALFDVAVLESDPEQIERDLSAIVDAMTGHAELQRAFTSPGVPTAVRLNVVRAVAEKVGAQPPLAKLVVMLAERGRLELLPVLREVYRDRLRAHRNVVQAEVTSAVPLAAEQVHALGRSLGSLTGKQVELAVGVDPALIGGVVARIGSTVYDGSIRTQLQKMKQELVDKG